MLNRSVVKKKKITLINGSFAVFLPKAWCELNKLSKGKEILMKLTAEKIIITPEIKGGKTNE